MEFSSEMVCRVALPPSLPPMDHLAKLEGNILLHSVEPVDQGIALEGDLLWRGLFPDDSGVLQCLWEGAEFFREIFSTEAMRRGDDLTVSPEVRSVTGEIKDDDTYELHFNVRWWDYHPLDTESEAVAETVENDSEQPAVTAKNTEEHRDEATVSIENREEDETMQVEDNVEETTSASPVDHFEQEIKAIDDTFRETIKVLADDSQPIQGTSAAHGQSSGTKTAEVSEPLAVSVSKETESAQEESSARYIPSNGSYCLRYYRARPGDSLDAIAERLSVSLARMREINELDEVGIIDTKELENRMIRIE